MTDEPQLPTLMDVREKLQLIDHSRLAEAASTPDRAGNPAQRAATYPARLALAAMACADSTLGSARRAGATHAKVLDLACGSAMISRIVLAAGAASVTAADANPAMIEAAESCGPAAGLRLDCIDATQQLPYPDSSFDMVWIGNFWQPDMLPEVRRVLRPGGRLVLRWTTALDWIPAADPIFAERVAAAVETGMARWSSQGADGGDTWPSGALPGLTLTDSWADSVEFRAPLPEAVQEYVLQDFACFHGAFARAALDDGDWAKLCNLMDPASPEFALTSEHARVAWTFEYRVHVPVA
ncbi:class I SAM-dependent methyltransferase [Bifidobacterium tibiigranuli]|nr:class I SAM-dependent methyltransferase [Bifidobacterium tibiigranuli]MCI1673076.1 class I SAM-dependent methyltransferase [Bifidobacterium tibiigranuli]MCI1713176.1 class I SAM-dependent methyltransferase [Bifidobacterium tibiigranuli]MCI1834830.1 class I SAM-dependent methyltransferase [Bifidobacterium tibiigranuli]